MIEAIGAIGAAGAKAPDTPARIKDSATQFESLLMAQLLKSMRQSGGGWLGTDEDDAGGMMLDIAEEHLSQVLAAQGGLGLANLVSQGLKSQSQPK
jgi:Rod binding domain-containing protein